MGIKYKSRKPAVAAWRVLLDTKRNTTITRSASRPGNECCCRKFGRRREDELIVADGFSCQEQIRQETNRTALHPAQVMQMALRGDDAGCDGAPEKRMRGPAECEARGSSIGGAGTMDGGGVQSWTASAIRVALDGVPGTRNSPTRGIT